MNKPVRLEKKEPKVSPMDNFEGILQKYAPYILTACIIILFVLVLLLIGTIFAGMVNGTAHVPSMTDSGNLYNHLEDIL